MTLTFKTLDNHSFSIKEIGSISSSSAEIFVTIKGNHYPISKDTHYSILEHLIPISLEKKQ